MHVLQLAEHHANTGHIMSSSFCTGWWASEEISSVLRGILVPKLSASVHGCVAEHFATGMLDSSRNPAAAETVEEETQKYPPQVCTWFSTADVAMHMRKGHCVL